MKRVRKQGEAIRHWIISNVETHPRDIAKAAAEQFGISRQGANKHLSRLYQEGVLIHNGKTRDVVYKLAPTAEWQKVYLLSTKLEEDRVFREDIVPLLGAIPDNVMRIWQYGFTEMFNNAIDHSEGTYISVGLVKLPQSTQITIADDGVGIFRKIQIALGLADERHSLLELSKGKLTTDPARHSGEGIFFASRAFDSFTILSGDTFFSHEVRRKNDWAIENGKIIKGTRVDMALSNHSSRSLKSIFEEYSTDDNYGFNKTVVPVDLARYGAENLVSRSQAKRVLARVDRFLSVLLDFEGVDSIGQAFADEIFRVFVTEHPDIELTTIRANEEVSKMIQRAKEAR